MKTIIIKQNGLLIINKLCAEDFALGFPVIPTKINQGILYKYALIFSTMPKSKKDN